MLVMAVKILDVEGGILIAPACPCQVPGNEILVAGNRLVGHQWDLGSSL
jgi:hypothetical protein